jgi:oligopeptide transport system substrate-binding protein
MIYYIEIRGLNMERTIRLFVAFCFALAVTGCGNSSNNADIDEPLAIVQRGNGADPGTLDPALANDVHAFNVLIDLYEGLLSEDANGELVPGVAESWHVSEDGLTYTFELRRTARWSNGDPVSAYDFVRSLRRVAAPETASTYAFLLAPILNFAAINSDDLPPDELAVAALSEHQLEIRLATPVSHWLSILTLPITYPTHRSGDGGISNGAYRLIDREAGGLIRIEKNEHYWAQESVGVDQVVYRPIADPLAEYNQYRTGELDITNSIPVEMMQAAIADFGTEVRISPALALYYIAFDLTEPPFDNQDLREALSAAIDREKLVEILGRGEQAAYGIVPPGVSGYQSAAIGWRDESQLAREQRARKLYSQAGYTFEAPLKIRFLYDSDGIHERLVLAVTAMWREVLGVKTTLENREWKYYLESRDRRGDWDVMHFAWSGDYNSPRTFLDIFQSSNEQNLSRYSSIPLDEALLASAHEVDPGESTAQMHAAELIILTDHPIAPLYFYVSKHMVKPHINGFEDNAVDRHPSKYLTVTTE